MIGSREFKYICLQIPHTGSTSMAQWCKRYYGGVHFGYKHEYRIPPGPAEKWFRFCLVRNPYDRILTWWWHGLERGSELSIAEFLDFIIDRKDIMCRDKGLKIPRFYMNQTAWIEETGATPLRLEDVINTKGEVLKRLPFVKNTGAIRFPHLNRTKTKPRAPVKEYIADRPDLIDKIFEHSGPDFKRFGYEE